MDTGTTPEGVTGRFLARSLERLPEDRVWRRANISLLL
jgi:hypothetical protein